MKQASKLRSNWIVARTVLTTMRYCFNVIFASLIVKNKRHVFDNYARRWSKALLRYPRVNLEVINPTQFTPQENSQYIIMSNHISHYDIPLIFCAFPSGSIRMLAKSELYRIPLFGRALRAGEFPPIDRKNREVALRNLDYAKELMQKGIMIWISPEGTRSRTNTLGSFKKGGFMMALQTGATIIPVGIKGSFEILPPQTKQYTLEQTATVTIGRPIDSKDYSIRTREALMNEVEKQIRELTAQSL